MGGGGGSSSGRLGDTRALEEKAKRVLEGGRKNVFISFAHEDMNEVNLLRGQSKNENSEIEFNDFSVKEPYNSDRAEYIKAKLTERISQSSTTVVYLSNETSKSEWVRWEVEKSVELGKKVIAVHAGTRAPNIPRWISDKRIKTIPWSSLADEIKKA